VLGIRETTELQEAGESFTAAHLKLRGFTNRMADKSGSSGKSCLYSGDILF
jgi:hypothetical protein